MNSTSADFQNLYQALSRSAARSPDALALAFEDRRYLYRDFHLRVQRAMAQLDRGWSLRKGDRILLARALLYRATLQRIMGHLTESIADANECMTLVQNQLEFRKIQGEALRHIGQCYFHQGKLRDAIHALDEALQIIGVRSYTDLHRQIIGDVE